jgi:hypothetical protein
VALVSAGAGVEAIEATQTTTSSQTSVAAGKVPLQGSAFSTISTNQVAVGALSLVGHSAHSIPPMGEAAGQLWLQGTQSATLEWDSWATAIVEVSGAASGSTAMSSVASGALPVQAYQVQPLDAMLGEGSLALAIAGQSEHHIDSSSDALGAVQASSYSVTPNQANLVYQLALLHGLVNNHPLQVTDTSRSAGSLAQVVSGSDVVTITTSSAPSLVGDVGTWIEALAALHGLTVPLVVSANSRNAGPINQAITQVGSLTTVTRQ